MRVVGRSDFGYSGINFDVSKFATLSSMLGPVFLFVSKNGKWNSRFHFNDVVNLKRWNASNNEYVELFEMGLISQNNLLKNYISVLLQYKKRSFKFLITTRVELKFQIGSLYSTQFYEQIQLYYKLIGKKFGNFDLYWATHFTIFESLFIYTRNNLSSPRKLSE